jgi:phosphatidylglycerophosphatase A
MSQRTANIPNSATSNATSKPRVSLAIATAFGLGYLPKAPGTWGSLGGVVLTALYWSTLRPDQPFGRLAAETQFRVSPTWIAVCVTLLIAILGVAASTTAAYYIGKKDPQIVVIDEVSGQLITYFGIGAALPNWKYLLLGFILFRVFDIWKPFPARQAEALPGGLGIMADDWIAGIYAGLGLWIVRTLAIRLGLHLGL